jgi:hypothetical protein
MIFGAKHKKEKIDILKIIYCQLYILLSTPIPGMT